MNLRGSMSAFYSPSFAVGNKPSGRYVFDHSRKTPELTQLEKPGLRELTLELASRKLSDRDLAKVKEDLPALVVEDDVKEITLIRGMAAKLQLQEQEVLRLLAIKPTAGVAFLEALRRGVSISEDVESRIQILFEIILATSTIINKPADDSAVRLYLEKKGYLNLIKDGSFEKLLEVQYRLFAQAGGPWGRKDATKSIDQR